jgi:hypothetical protein
MMVINLALNYPRQKQLNFITLYLNFLSDEGLNNREAQHELGCSDKTIYRLIGSCKESLYMVYGDDIQIVYSRATNRYKLVINKSRFNLRNFPFLA